MEEPLVQRFFARAEESLVEAWKVSARDDTEYRERLYYFVGLTREYKEFFQYFLDSEAYALQQIKDMEELE